MSAEEIASLLIIAAREGEEDKLHEFGVSLSASTHKNDEGCINYTFHRRVDNPREFILYERWLDQAALEAHLARLNKIYGSPAPGDFFPPALLEMIEKAEMVLLQVME
jgi:quinol monooxygenase YgiN